MAYVLSSTSSWDSPVYRQLADSPLGLNVAQDVMDLDVSPFSNNPYISSATLITPVDEDDDRRGISITGTPVVVYDPISPLGATYNPLGYNPLGTTYNPLGTAYNPLGTTYGDSLGTPFSPVYSSTLLNTPSVIAFDAIDTLSSPILPSLAYDYNQPITVSYYSNLNADPRVHARITKNLYYQLLDKWLYGDLVDILNYFRVKDGKVVLISSMKDYNSAAVEKDTIDSLEKKIDYIQKHFFTIKDMKKLLNNYVSESGTNWYDLIKKPYFIKKEAKDVIMRSIKHALRK